MPQDQIGFVISKDDQRIAVGEITDLVAHLVGEAANAGIGEPFADREIYDSTGTLLDFAENEGGGFVLEVPPGRQPEVRQLLLDRIDAALRNTQVRVDRSANATIKDYRVPSVVGDLDVVLAALAVAYGPIPNGLEASNPNHGLPLHEAEHNG